MHFPMTGGGNIKSGGHAYWFERQRKVTGERNATAKTLKNLIKIYDIFDLHYSSILLR